MPSCQGDKIHDISRQRLFSPFQGQKCPSNPFLQGYFYGFQLRGSIFSWTHVTASSIEVPGVKTLFTPISVRAGISSSGMTPPPKTMIVSAPFCLRSSMTFGRYSREHRRAWISRSHRPLPESPWRQSAQDSDGGLNR